MGHGKDTSAIIIIRAFEALDEIQARVRVLMLALDGLAETSTHSVIEQERHVDPLRAFVDDIASMLSGLRAVIEQERDVDPLSPAREGSQHPRRQR